jgi:hypothetical protein
MSPLCFIVVCQFIYLGSADDAANLGSSIAYETICRVFNIHTTGTTGGTSYRITQKDESQKFHIEIRWF